MDEATLQQILKSVDTSGTGSSTGSLFDINSIMQSLAPYMIALTIVSVLITILYMVSVIAKWRANKAVVDIKKLLIEMNERDKARDRAAPVSPATAPIRDVIAVADDSTPPPSA
jgi:hypothetical protein